MINELFVYEVFDSFNKSGHALSHHHLAETNYTHGVWFFYTFLRNDEAQESPVSVKHVNLVSGTICYEIMTIKINGD